MSSVTWKTSSVKGKMKYKYEVTHNQSLMWKLDITSVIVLILKELCVWWFYICHKMTCCQLAQYKYELSGVYYACENPEIPPVFFCFSSGYFDNNPDNLQVQSFIYLLFKHNKSH